METIRKKFVIEATPTGEYFAYLADHKQCCAYGETPYEALEGVEVQAEEIYGEVYSLFYDIA